MNRIFTAAILITIVYGAPGFGSTRLSLEQAVAEGLKNSHTLAAVQSSADAADAAASASSAGLLPTLSAGGTYTRLSDVPGFEIALPTGDAITINDPILNSYNFRVSVEQPLFTGGRLRGGVQTQKTLAKAARADFETNRRELIFQIHYAYWQLYKAREFKSVIDDNVVTMQAHLQDVRNFLEQGIVTKTEVLAVEVQLSHAKLLQIDATDQVQLAALALCNLTGLPLDSDFELTTTPAQSHEDQSRADLGLLRQTALDQRSELKAFELKVRAGQAGIRSARGGWLPQVRAFGNLYYARPNARIFPAHDQFDDTWDVGVGATWTLWNWGATGYNVKQAKAQVRQAEHALQALKDGISVEVTADVLNVTEAQEKITVAQAGARFAEESFRSTREKFKNGLAPNSDVLDAENELLKARWNQTQALVDYEVATAKLAKSTGQQQ